MDELFLYNAMWGTLKGNLTYELNRMQWGLSEVQYAMQERAQRLYMQSCILNDASGGRQLHEPLESLTTVHWQRS